MEEDYLCGFSCCRWCWAGGRPCSNCWRLLYCSKLDAFVLWKSPQRLGLRNGSGSLNDSASRWMLPRSLGRPKNPLSAPIYSFKPPMPMAVCPHNNLTKPDMGISTRIRVRIMEYLVTYKRDSHFGNSPMLIAVSGKELTGSGHHWTSTWQPELT